MDRIRNKSEIVGDCWIWKGTYSSTNPIIRLKDPRRLYSARRYSYEMWNGVDVPKTHVVSAKCKNSRCVNPAHLVTIIRGAHAMRHFGFKSPTHCQRGHEWSEWNTGKQKSSNARLCLACDRERKRLGNARRRIENPAHEKNLRVLRVATAKEFIAIFKRRPCKRCGENHPACLDFHHRDPHQKDRSIASALRMWGLERILAEIEKCDVLCANCHRKLHWEERKQAVIQES